MKNYISLCDVKLTRKIGPRAELSSTCSKRGINMDDHPVELSPEIEAELPNQVQKIRTFWRMKHDTTKNGKDSLA